MTIQIGSQPQLQHNPRTNHNININIKPHHHIQVNLTSTTYKLVQRTTKYINLNTKRPTSQHHLSLECPFPQSNVKQERV